MDKLKLVLSCERAQRNAAVASDPGKDAAASCALLMRFSGDRIYDYLAFAAVPGS
jgi:hypothetical protein